MAELVVTSKHLGFDSETSLTVRVARITGFVFDQLRITNTIRVFANHIRITHESCDSTSSRIRTNTNTSNCHWRITYESCDSLFANHNESHTNHVIRHHHESESQTRTIQIINDESHTNHVIRSIRESQRITRESCDSTSSRIRITNTNTSNHHWRITYESCDSRITTNHVIRHIRESQRITHESCDSTSSRIRITNTSNYHWRITYESCDSECSRITTNHTRIMWFVILRIRIRNHSKIMLWFDWRILWFVWIRLIIRIRTNHSRIQWLVQPCSQLRSCIVHPHILSYRVVF